MMISFDKFLDTDPRVEYYPEFDATGEGKGYNFDGIKALAYDGADYMGSHTKIYAHIGFPENIKEPIPAVVLVHGGGGHPEDIWIKKWNEKGYAAISMDTTGFFPTQPMPHVYEGFKEGLDRSLVAPFLEEGYVVGPDNARMADLGLPIKDQWLYHAVSSVILAHNILRNDERVDKNKIGICGISWGGVITSLAIGHDPRFAFAIPIYSSGYLGCGHTDLNYGFKRPGAEIWFAEKRFDRVNMPVLWLCWNDDSCFSINSNSMSYLDTKANNPSTRLSMLHEMRHSHLHGYTPEESYWFADSVLKGDAIPKPQADYEDGKVHYSCDAKIKSARLFYITDKLNFIQREKYGSKGSFMEQDWQIIDLDINENSAELPQDTVGRYIEFTLENGIILTTPYAET